MAGYELTKEQLDKLPMPVKIECLTLRVGTSPVQIGKSGHPYIFQERRDALSMQEGPTSSVCQVDSLMHVSFLLKQGNFRLYDPKVPPPAAHPIWDMGNYHIEKCVVGQTEGYRVCRKNPQAFAGRDGTWRPAGTADEMKLALQSIVPFDRESAAFYWLEDYVKNNHPELQIKSGATVGNPDEVSAKDSEIATLRAENARILAENSQIKSLIPSAEDLSRLIDVAVNKRMCDTASASDKDEPDFLELAGKKKKQ